MRGILPKIFCLNFFFYGTVLAQDFSSQTETSVSTSTSAQLHAATVTPSPTSSSIELTPAMSSSSVASFFSALATTEPTAPDGPAAGDAGSSAGSSGADSDAGASGTSAGSVQMSTGVMVAIIVAVVGVCLFGSKNALHKLSSNEFVWPHSTKLTLLNSHLISTLLPGKEKIVGGAQENPCLCTKSSCRFNAKENDFWKGCSTTTIRSRIGED
jgi:hypothetical protein